MLYDVIIIGGGPAGLSAGLYAGRARLNTLILEKGMPGGQIFNTADIENYPGQMAEETGPSLVERMTAQADKFGCSRVTCDVTGVDFEGAEKVIYAKNSEYRARAVIIATGAAPKPLDCKNEEEFRGRGVSYCATCDGALYRNKRIIVAGGGDSALSEALFLTRFAREVTIVHRRMEFRAAEYLQERVRSNEKIKLMLDSVVDSLEGDGILKTVNIKNVKTDEVTALSATEEEKKIGLFGFVGLVPATDVFQGKLELTEGYIKTDENMQTSVPGVYAAGDIRVKSLRQVVTAAADGAIAAVAAEKYISGV